MISWSNDNFIFLGYHTLEGDIFISLFAIVLLCFSTGEFVGGCLQGCLWRGCEVTLAALESPNFCRRFPLVHHCCGGWRSSRDFMINDLVFGLVHYLAYDFPSTVSTFPSKTHCPRLASSPFPSVSLATSWDIPWGYSMLIKPCTSLKCLSKLSFSTVAKVQI